jgi:predicted NBD/HSP70 family sugar kinase
MRELPFQSLGMRDLRIVNELRLLNLIRQAQPISRVQISNLTGLNASTVTMIVKRLIAHQMVSETTTGPSTGGRRPTFLTINPDKMFVLGVDLGVWMTSYSIADFNGRQLLYRTLPTMSESEEFVLKLCDDIVRSISEARLPGGKGLSAVGVSVPELVDIHDGSMILGLEQGWVKVRVRQLFEERLGVPTFVENDASAAALGEIWLGSTKTLNFDNVVYVLVVEGIGTGLIIEGRLYRGSRLGTGGFGHMPMDPAGPPCFCGARGCWESLASDKALRRYFAEMGGEGIAPSGEGAQAASIVEAAIRGNATALRALTKTAHYLGLGILGLVHGLSPQLVVVGGHVASAWSIVSPIIHERVRSRMHHPTLAPVEIKPASAPYPPSLPGGVAVALSGILEREVVHSLPLAQVTGSYASP